MSARARRPTRQALLLTAGSLVLSGVVLLAPEAPLAATAVPAPEAVLGFVPGEDRRLADWEQVVRYVKALGAASERVRVLELGKTTEGRPFLLAIVTSAENQARLEAIRQANARLADPRGLSPQDTERLIAGGKTVVAMAFSIHSTEVGGTLAALRLLHHLASAEDATTRAILEQTVLLVLPSHNPDGTDLVARWYRQQLGTPFEGTAPPQLYQPYVGHDNNRDWYMFTQRESRLTLEGVYQRWHPQIVHDVHQMGSRGARLFVPPYTDPWEPNVDPALVAATNALGAHVASRLATLGRSGVVTGALFDAWTPARAYAHTHGGVRILSETASARLATPVELRAAELEGEGGFDPRTPSARFPLPWPGGAWRLSDIVATQLQVSLAILDHAAAHREHWLRTALEVNRRACARVSPFAYVIPAAQRDPLATARLLQVLHDGEVEIERARAEFVAGGRRYPAGSSVVRLQQPASGFAKMLMETQRYPDRRERPDGPPLRPYDVTAHTLPLLLGVEVEAIAAPFEADLARVGTPGVEPGRLEGEGPRFALGHSSGDLAALGPLLEAGVPARWALEPFEEAGRRFEPGTLLVPASARAVLEPLVRELGLVGRAVHTQARSLRLSRPRVGLYRSWVPAIDEGWTRFVFEREMHVGYQTLHDGDVRGGRLRARFDAIVLADQSPAAIRDGHAAGSMPPQYTGGLGAEGTAALRAFVEDGGTLVALDSASEFAIEALKLPVRNALAGVDPARFSCPGSILRATPNPTALVAQGLASPLPIWFERSPAFEVESGTVLLRYESEDPLLSGFLLGGGQLRGRAALVEVPLGKGRVLLYGFRPQYRAQSWSSYPALLNALYLSAAAR